VNQSSSKDPPRGLKLSAFEMVTYSRVSKILHQKGVFSVKN
jgi:hypothetical protein